MIRTVVVDDEPKARNTLIKLLEEFAPEVEILVQCSSVDEAYKTILKNKPELVFLDVEMPPNTGFDLLEKFNHREFEVIFITAYSKYAINAIKESAIDYIVKPIIVEELVNALSKVRSRLKERGENRKNKLLLSDSNHLKPVYVDTVTRCESFKNYTTFYFSNGEKFTVSKPIGHFEEQMAEQKFVRVHNSHIVNIDYILHLDRVNDHLVMKDGTEVPVSRRRKEHLLNIL